MKRLIGCALVLVAAACNDGSTGLTEPVQYARGGVEGAVSPELKVFVGGAVVYRESGASNSGVGSCVSGGRWNNSASKYTTSAAHPNCASVAGQQSAVVNLAVVAGKQGASAILTGSDGWLWYQKGPDRTAGSGVFSAADGSWVIAGTQALLNDRGNFMAPNGMVVMACGAAGCHPGLLTW